MTEKEDDVSDPCALHLPCGYDHDDGAHDEGCHPHGHPDGESRVLLHTLPLKSLEKNHPNPVLSNILHHENPVSILTLTNLLMLYILMGEENYGDDYNGDGDDDDADGSDGRAPRNNFLSLRYFLFRSLYH